MICVDQTSFCINLAIKNLKHLYVESEHDWIICWTTVIELPFQTSEIYVLT